MLATKVREDNDPLMFAAFLLNVVGKQPFIEGLTDMLGMVAFLERLTVKSMRQGYSL